LPRRIAAAIWPRERDFHLELNRPDVGAGLLIRDEDLADIYLLPHVHSLDLIDERLIDRFVPGNPRDLGDIVSVGSERWYKFHHSPITDVGAKHLETLRELYVLDLHRAAIDRENH
jgi:hypothetical protein